MMHRVAFQPARWPLLLLLALLPSLARTQTPTPNSTDITAQNENCTTLLTHANATGSVSFLAPEISSTNLTWVLSVNSPGHPTSPFSSSPSTSTSYEAEFWLATPPDIDFFNGANNFSACAIYIAIPANTIKRGQHDDGSCEQTLSPECVASLTTSVASRAFALTRGVPLQGAATGGVSDVCNALQDNLFVLDSNGHPLWPSVCQPFFTDESGLVLGSLSITHLTDNQTTTPTCAPTAPANLTTVPQTSILTPISLGPIQRPATGNTTADNITYASLIQTPYPLMTVFFPAANNTRTSAIQHAHAQLSCLRATVISPGSMEPTPLDSAAAPDSAPETHRLGIGAIAGIVVALVLLAALVGAAGWWYWRRRALGGRGGYGNLAAKTGYVGAGGRGMGGSTDRLAPMELGVVGR